MNLPSLIPTGWLLPGAIAIAGAWALWGGVQTARLHHAQAEIQDVRNAMALERANATAAMLKQSQDFRAEEARRTAAQQEKIDAAEKIAQKARADAAIADAAAGRLRERYAAALADAREAARNPTVATSGTSAPAGDLPADMFSRLLEIAGQYRDAAEAAIISGELAEGAYDALTAEP